MPGSFSGDLAGNVAAGTKPVGRRVELSVLALPLVAEFLPDFGTATAVVDGLQMRGVDIPDGVVRLRFRAVVTRIHSKSDDVPST